MVTNDNITNTLPCLAASTPFHNPISSSKTMLILFMHYPRLFQPNHDFVVVGSVKVQDCMSVSGPCDKASQSWCRVFRKTKTALLFTAPAKDKIRVQRTFITGKTELNRDGRRKRVLAWEVISYNRTQICTYSAHDRRKRKKKNEQSRWYGILSFLVIALEGSIQSFPQHRDNVPSLGRGTWLPALFFNLSVLEGSQHTFSCHMTGLALKCVWYVFVHLWVLFSSRDNVCGTYWILRWLYSYPHWLQSFESKRLFQFFFPPHLNIIPSCKFLVPMNKPNISISHTCTGEISFRLWVSVTVWKAHIPDNMATCPQRGF